MRNLQALFFNLLLAGALGLATGCDDDDDDAVESNPACENLPTGPISPVVINDNLGMAEDLAFDGQGAFVTMGPEETFVKVAPDGTTTDFPVQGELPQGGGLRYLADGRLVFALFTGGKVIDISPDGEMHDFLPDVNGPNAIHADMSGNVWITESFGNRILKVTPDGAMEVITKGGIAASPNGVVYDEDREVLFFAAGLGDTEMTIGRIEFDADGAPKDPVAIYTLAGASGDGITLDSCGNLYIVEVSDAGNGIRRLKLDADGEVVQADRIADYGTWMTNIQFGSGPGFEPTRLYSVGFGHQAAYIDVGVTGAPVPVPGISR